MYARLLDVTNSKHAAWAKAPTQSSHHLLSAPSPPLHVPTIPPLHTRCLFPSATRSIQQNDLKNYHRRSQTATSMYGFLNFHTQVICEHQFLHKKNTIVPHKWETSVSKIDCDFNLWHKLLASSSWVVATYHDHVTLHTVSTHFGKLAAKDFSIRFKLPTII